MSLETQCDLESTYVMHTFGRKPVELVSGQGMVVKDDAGKEYLDFLAGIGVVSLGHCHPAVVESLQLQAKRLIHVGNYYYIEERGEVAQRLSGLLNEQTPDAPAWQSFFANSGAEANECAIKLARLFAKKQDGTRANKATPRFIVTLERSFHGRTIATLAATAQPAKQEAFQPLPDGFLHTPLNDIAALEALFMERGDDICAVMIECVQGEGGVNLCTLEFMQAVRRLTSQHGALLICDEVQTGIYRCGAYPFAFQHYRTQPDIVTIAKGVASGMPAGMCAARTEVARAFEPGDHGSTFGGSCLAIAAANATLQALKDGNYAQQVERVGVYLRERLAKLPGVTEVRGLGLMVAADLQEGLDANDVVTRALAEGLLINATSSQTLRFLPPLVCTEQDIDVLIERLARLIAV